MPKQKKKATLQPLRRASEFSSRQIVENFKAVCIKRSVPLGFGFLTMGS